MKHSQNACPNRHRKSEQLRRLISSGKCFVLYFFGCCISRWAAKSLRFSVFFKFFLHCPTCRSIADLIAANKRTESDKMKFPREMANTEKCGDVRNAIYAVTARGNCRRHHHDDSCETENKNDKKKHNKYFAQRTWAPEHRLTCTVGHHCWQTKYCRDASHQWTLAIIALLLSLPRSWNASRCHHFDENYLSRISIVPSRVSQSEKNNIWFALIAPATSLTFDRFIQEHGRLWTRNSKENDWYRIDLSLRRVLLFVKMANRWSAIAFSVHRFSMSVLMLMWSRRILRSWHVVLLRCCSSPDWFLFIEDLIILLKSVHIFLYEHSVDE